MYGALFKQLTQFWHVNETAHAEHVSSLKLQTSPSGFEQTVPNNYFEQLQSKSIFWWTYTTTWICVFFFGADYVKKNVTSCPSWNARQEHQFEVTFSEYIALEFPSL